MKTLNFDFSEFVITGVKIPILIASKILHYHILPGQAVRDELNENSDTEIKLYPSLNSCYRPLIWELNHSRTGKSEHTFGELKNGSIDPKKKGATDWTCTDFKKNKEALFEALVKNTNYTRIAIYATFIHCDYKATDGKRYVFKSNSKSQWTLIGYA